MARGFVIIVFIYIITSCPGIGIPSAYQISADNKACWICCGQISFRFR